VSTPDLTVILPECVSMSYASTPLSLLLVEGELGQWSLDILSIDKRFGTSGYCTEGIAMAFVLENTSMQLCFLSASQACLLEGVCC